MNELFMIMLLLLIILTLVALNPYRLKHIKQKPYRFEKAKTNYIVPPRPLSNTYSNYHKLTSSVYKRRYRELALLLSQLINEYIELNGQFGTLLGSKNLNLLIDDPDGWYRLQLDLFTQSDRFTRISLTHFIRENYIQILNEVQQVLEVPLFINWSDDKNED